MNDLLSYHILQTLIDQGVQECCICPGARNAPLVEVLTKQTFIHFYYWPEERSAAFFALGRIKAHQRPVAVITTSGTAAGELLPSAMEAYYTGLPLILITADRPRRFRGLGAPQTAEQVGLFGVYALISQDLEKNEQCDLSQWRQQGPIHINVCFEDPTLYPLTNEISLKPKSQTQNQPSLTSFFSNDQFNSFLQNVTHPLVIVSALQIGEQENIVRFLLNLQAPVYLEALSGIREDPRLDHLKIVYPYQLWKQAANHGYPINGILRIGGIPTVRLWRDIEDKQDEMIVCSISSQPFAGVNNSTLIHTDLNLFFSQAMIKAVSQFYPCQAWITANQQAYKQFLTILDNHPQAEMSLVCQLSLLIPSHSTVYLGNSLPIREWDLCAVNLNKHFKMFANRGLNGIDGQLSTFLGCCTNAQPNFAILGDLTTLYDLAGPWIFPQLEKIQATCFVINNGGGKIFSNLFEHPIFQNLHQLSFEPLARLWNWNYEQWNLIPNKFSFKENHSHANLIEIRPCEQATNQALEKIKKIH